MLLAYLKTRKQHRIYTQAIRKLFTSLDFDEVEYQPGYRILRNIIGSVINSWGWA